MNILECSLCLCVKPISKHRCPKNSSLSSENIPETLGETQNQELLTVPRNNSSCWNLDFRFLASRTVKQKKGKKKYIYICCLCTQVVVVCYSHSILVQNNAHTPNRIFERLKLGYINIVASLYYLCLWSFKQSAWPGLFMWELIEAHLTD